MDISVGCKPFLPAQWAGFVFDPPTGEIGVTAFLGGWGSGKTHGAARKFLRRCLENGWHDGYGRGGNPTSIMVAPTHKVLTQATLAQFRSVCPRELIIYDRAAPHNDIMLVNGHRILKHSGESEIEGMDACVVWIDEIHRPTFAMHPHRYMNLLARLRDPHAQRKEMIVSGLPESGWVRDTFDTSSPSRKTILMATRDNPNIDQALVGMFFEHCPGGHEQMLLGGQWIQPEGAVYSQFDPTIHVVGWVLNRAKPVHVGVDVGNWGCMLIAQECEIACRDITGKTRPEKGMIIVDQILTHDETVEAACLALKIKTEWIVSPNVSTICTDPMVRRDELQVLRKHFPGVKIVKRERGHEHFPIESGIRITQRSLRDAVGNVRLFFHQRLKSDNRKGVLDSILRYRRRPGTGAAVKDDASDHTMDALRYLCAEHLQADRPQARVL